MNEGGGHGPTPRVTPPDAHAAHKARHPVDTVSLQARTREPGAPKSCARQDARLAWHLATARDEMRATATAPASMASVALGRLPRGAGGFRGAREGVYVTSGKLSRGRAAQVLSGCKVQTTLGTIFTTAAMRYGQDYARFHARIHYNTGANQAVQVVSVPAKVSLFRCTSTLGQAFQHVQTAHGRRHSVQHGHAAPHMAACGHAWRQARKVHPALPTPPGPALPSPCFTVVRLRVMS